MKPFKEGITFEETKYRPVFSRNKHFKLIRDDIQKRLEGLKVKLVDGLVNFVENIRTVYMEELKKNIDAKMYELDEIEKAKINAEQTREIINNFIFKIEKMNDAQRDVRKMKGGIDKHV